MQLKTLDILQITYAVLSESSLFVTFDKDILNKKEIVENYTGIKVVNLDYK
ncbi:hypothetical protein IC006_0435 [Sulfuracidifex tepidarius]|uniref:PIN domain-containing protein n=1 Tax=Sulfuracidifex tepidarius TaxID=1294262 RepID=A0A510DSJ5_9CREN|nr:hypothetical protein [Sulfuracidifex tepidarius]BBG23151.1 hypothetical protein IC006_0435 [Sulfuracidifex tepidarius]